LQPLSYFVDPKLREQEHWDRSLALLGRLRTGHDMPARDS
jgi:hypothetical protein